MKHLQKIKKRNTVLIYIASTALLLASVFLGISLGASDIGISDFVKSIFEGDLESPEARILLYVRLPRVIGALICGAALAVSGAVIQGVLANPLASPSLIGINSGAGLAVTVCSALGIAGGFRLSIFAFAGAFATALLVSLGAKKFGASKGTVILIGVALNTFLGAISDTVIAFIPDVTIMSYDFKMGDFSAVTYLRLIPAGVIILLSLLILFTLSNELDVLTLGDDSAKGLGLNTGVMRVIFLILAALLAGSAVSICGLLSFVGLLVPHAVKRSIKKQTKHILPLCALLGAGFVTLCDTLARVIFAPFEIPVGIIMAFIGVPFFIFILIKRKGGHGHD